MEIVNCLGTYIRMYIHMYMLFIFIQYISVCTYVMGMQAPTCSYTYVHVSVN